MSGRGSVRPPQLMGDPVAERARDVRRLMTVPEAAARLKLIDWIGAERAIAGVTPARGLCPCGATGAAYAKDTFHVGLKRPGPADVDDRPRGGAKAYPNGASDSVLAARAQGAGCVTCRGQPGDVIDLARMCIGGGFHDACRWIEDTVKNTRCDRSRDLFGGR